MSSFEFCRTCCMHWYRHRLRRPLDVFDSSIYFRLFRNFRCLSDKQFIPCTSTNAVRRRLAVIEPVLQLIPVSSLFAQPTKMVWVTIYDKVLLWTNCFAMVLLYVLPQFLFLFNFDFLSHVYYYFVSLGHYTSYAECSRICETLFI